LVFGGERTGTVAIRPAASVEYAAAVTLLQSCHHRCGTVQWRRDGMVEEGDTVVSGPVLSLVAAHFPYREEGQIGCSRFVGGGDW
jgi:hypothetical protein